MGRRKKTKANGVNHDVTLEEDSVTEEGATVAPPPDAPMKTRYLKCPLTQGQRSGYAKRMAKTLASVSDLEAERDTLKEQAKNKQKEIDLVVERVRTMGSDVLAGYTNKNVPCEEREACDDSKPDSVLVGVGTYRLDTNEQIEWRPLRKDERQGKLFDPPAVDA